MGSIYYDFRDDKVESFIGASMGNTSVEFDGATMMVYLMELVMV